MTTFFWRVPYSCSVSICTSVCVHGGMWTQLDCWTNCGFTLGLGIMKSLAVLRNKPLPNYNVISIINLKFLQKGCLHRLFSLFLTVDKIISKNWPKKSILHTKMKILSKLTLQKTQQTHTTVICNPNGWVSVFLSKTIGVSGKRTKHFTFLV